MADDVTPILRQVTDQAQREFSAIYQGRIRTCGEFTLTATATATAVTKLGVSTQSCIFTQAFSTNAANADITRIVPAKDAFTVYHTNPGAATKTHRFAHWTGVRSSTFEP